MRRKIFICFFVLLLMTTMVVPVFATSAGGNTSAAVSRPAVVVDYIRYLDGSDAGAVCDWPNNYSIDGASVYGNIDDIFMFDCSYTGSVFSTTFYPGNCTYVSFFCADYFWTDEQHFLIDDGGSDVVFSNVSITGNFAYMEAVNGRYMMRSKPFSTRVSVYGSEVYVDDLIGQAIADFDFRGDYAYLQDVTVTVTFYQNDTSVTPRFRTAIGSTSVSNLLNSWIYYQAIPFQIVEGGTDVNMFDWLLDSVNAFLNLEIAPGFSLNRIFYIVLVVGVLLWFITLLI